MKNWTPLQSRLCMAVALAKRDEFIIQSCWVSDLLKMGLVSRAEAGDLLQEVAVYNSLTFEYDADHIQEIMSKALKFGFVELSPNDPAAVL